MTQMRAVVKDGNSVRVRRVPIPDPAPGEVLIRVEVAGVCRTDIYVAQGRIPCADPLILGHEFSGTVTRTGPGVSRFASGDRVAVMPVLPCTTCARCAQGTPECCAHHRFLGVARHGAFAEFVAVPAEVVHPLPDGLSFREGAYAEPVCASLAVLKTGIRTDDLGMVYGANRIADLTARVLDSAGFRHVAATRTAPLAVDAYDFIIETQPVPSAFEEMIRAVRPGGRIVLKSRPAAPVGIDLTAALRKEVIFESAAYGTFQASLEFLVRHDISDLLGDTHALEDFERVFAADGVGERLKTFLAPGAGLQSSRTTASPSRVEAGAYPSRT
ncbi:MULTISPECIES: zinc-dependent alcohol dehydrogenase [Streptomyces]|uniref:zinc-dependent alcohol dehydrogenase n=1 Tax=Streptomyces TaxID=1883 RepID=UPI0019659BF0|nr:MULTISPECIES: alcohol dehydrogenase catalytic domain-containing protein [Streptomyces]QRX89643.1 alcohol dehydrogenase catalytic domain-containing protein [Streptomyces noursei]UJB39660.1 alcohol dehydrogenase catalytic domain-containing protein [Streptomyces sp. A1-5]